MRDSFRKQRTLAEPARVEGFGFWSGRDVTLEFRPAAADTGVVFVRGDLDPPVPVRAIVANRVEVPRRTTLAEAGVTVEMVEHVMAALAGLRIDNCEVWTDASEMPGCDGSSRAIVAALDAAGFVEQPAPRRRLIVREVARVGDKHAWIEARPADRPGLHVRYHLDFGPQSPIGAETFQITVTPESFRRELAASRTFILEKEARRLRARGLGRRTSHRDLLVFGRDGPIDNELRFRNECARHKALDLVGDLALAGCDLDGSFIAHCCGHRLNAQLVRSLLARQRGVEGWKRSA